MTEQIIKCKDCKYQVKEWREDRRMKEKGYWIYGCELIDDPFIGTPVWGEDDQFCSSAEMKEEIKFVRSFRTGRANMRKEAEND